MKKFEKFNIEKIRNGHPACTDDGAPAEYILTYREHEFADARHVFILRHPGRTTLQEVFDSGIPVNCLRHRLYLVGGGQDMWVNIFASRSVSEFYYDSREEAESAGRLIKGYLATAKIEIETKLTRDLVGDDINYVAELKTA